MNNITQFINDKELSFQKMLPKDNVNCQIKLRNYAFNLTTLLKEYSKLQKNNAKRFKKHFLDLSSKHTIFLSDIFNMVKLLTYNF